jgi:hypothetical protein
VLLAPAGDSLTYAGTAIHLQSSPACRADHDGLLEAARLWDATLPD